MRARASARPTTSLTPVCPQRLGVTWSSIITPAKPASPNCSTVRRTLTGLPWPVSPSPMTGIETAWQMARPWSSISVTVIRPVSGTARRAAATANPLMKVSGKPACSISRADRASKQHGTIRHPVPASRARRRSGADREELRAVTAAGGMGGGSLQGEGAIIIGPPIPSPSPPAAGGRRRDAVKLGGAPHRVVRLATPPVR